MNRNAVLFTEVRGEVSGSLDKITAVMLARFISPMKETVTVNLKGPDTSSHTSQRTDTI